MLVTYVSTAFLVCSLFPHGFSGTHLQGLQIPNIRPEFIIKYLPNCKAELFSIIVPM